NFAEANLDVPVTSGAYTVTQVEAGRSLTYTRLDNYWGKDLPVNKGRYNFKKITVEYFRDNTVALEAFKSGQYDFRSENTSKHWNTAYVGPNFDSGNIKKELIRNYSPQGMQGFAMNIRRDIFKDPRVRQAISYAMDFEWTNKNLFYGNYIRSESYFANSELAASGLPSPEELALLKPFETQLPPEVFSKAYEAPKTDGTGNIRNNLRIAMDLLKQAGWQIKDKKLVNAEGKPFKFEFLSISAVPEYERIILPFIKNLQLMGIEVTLRSVDTPQYKERTDSFDFDMLMFTIPQSNSPGNEQRSYFGSAAGKQKGGFNIIGIDSPVVDALTDKIVAAKTREELVTACRALDRVLLWGHYVVPNWHYPFYRVAYWKKLHHADTFPKYALDLDSWWAE
ncbi:MAG TPA: extracellular solute-binding protein, partial [Pseudomonadales bacterium]|nr:extracellular solute-binding protein [Pseudomonadales bacterium]